MTAGMLLRPTARLLVIDPEDRLLLFRFDVDWGSGMPRRFWATPGGALNPGETYSQAARRELKEETGLDLPVGKEVAQRTARFIGPDGELQADERYFLVRAGGDAPDWSGLEADEAAVMTVHKWWTLAELEATDEALFPEELANWLRRLIGAKRV